MTDALVHRGPDEGGYYDDPPSQLCLGMRRLSILDLEYGHQPMANRDQSVWIVYNGEIFNSPELRRQLEQRHHQFVTANSDTETLLKLYEEKQENMLADLNGMFAFVLHDRKRNLLFGARGTGWASSRYIMPGHRRPLGLRRSSKVFSRYLGWRVRSIMRASRTI